MSELWQFINIHVNISNRLVCLSSPVRCVCLRTMSWHSICGVHAGSAVSWETEYARTDWRTHVSVAIWNIYCCHWTSFHVFSFTTKHRVCNKFAFASFDEKMKWNGMKLMQTIQMTQYARVVVHQEYNTEWVHDGKWNMLAALSGAVPLDTHILDPRHPLVASALLLLSEWNANAIIHTHYTEFPFSHQSNSSK